MRFLLEKNKQKELIELSKKDKSWIELAKELKISEQYIRNDLRKEKRLLPDAIYKKLCDLAEVNFDKFILEKKDDNWGRAKGGKISKGNTKKLFEPSESVELAELVGVILGDGHIDRIIDGTKIRVYTITIAGDSNNDRIYLENYVSNLFKKIFGEQGRMGFSKNSNSCYFKIHGKKIVEFFNKKGIKSGNKKYNKQRIPEWILNNEEYLKACLRGLIDADGCIYYISKKTNRNLRVSFTSCIPALMSDVRNSFIKLGFNPSRVLREKEIYLSSKDDVSKFIKYIGFSNNKHLKRLQNFKNSR